MHGMNDLQVRSKLSWLIEVLASRVIVILIEVAVIPLSATEISRAVSVIGASSIKTALDLPSNGFLPFMNVEFVDMLPLGLLPTN